MHVIARLTPRIEKARIIELEGKPVTMTTAAAVDPPSRHDATDCGIPADLVFFRVLCTFEQKGSMNQEDDNRITLCC